MQIRWTSVAVLAAASGIVFASSRELVYRDPQAIDFSTLAPSSRTLSVAFGDLSGDGRADVAAGTVNNAVGYFAGTPDGGISTTLTILDQRYRAGREAGGVRAADADGDGDLDLLTSATFVPAYWYRNDGGGAFNEITGDADNENFASQAVFLDLGGDGDLDVIRNVYLMPYMTDPGVRIFENTGTAFVAAQRILGAIGARPAVADFDGDGLDDVALVRSTETVVLLQSPQGLLVGMPAVTHPSTNNARLVLDIEGDGDPDVIVNRRLLRNDGTGTLSLDATWNLGGDLWNPLAVDFDNDGLTDFVDVVSGTTLAVMRNTGGSFAAPETIPIGVTVTTNGTFQVGDADEDGRADVAWQRSSAPNLTILRQAGLPAPRDLVVSPFVIAQAGASTLVLTGNGFTDGATADLGPGVVSAVDVESPSAARVDVVVDPGVGGGQRTLRFSNPDEQATSAPVEFRSLDVAVGKGRLDDSVAPARDVMTIRGRFPRNSLSANGAFAGRTDGLRLEVGAGPGHYRLDIPADDPRWRVTRRGRRLVFETRFDEFPRVRLEVDPRRERFEARVSYFDYPLAPGDATVRATLGSDLGQDARVWEPQRRRPTRYSLR